MRPGKVNEATVRTHEATVRTHEATWQIVDHTAEYLLALLKWV